MHKPISGSRQARDRILGELRRELMGPSESDEVIKEFPSARYIVGRLAPARVDVDDVDALVDVAENDTLGAGAEDRETDSDSRDPPLVVSFNPSAIGLSFLVDSSVSRLNVEISWGDYKREDASHGPAWKRYHRQAMITGLPVHAAGKMRPLPLSGESAPDDVTIEGVDDPEICAEGVVHDFSGCRAVSLFVVNRRTRGLLRDRNKDERWIYQPSMRIHHGDGKPVFVARDLQSPADDDQSDGEELTNRLLYRHAREFATGHGVAADWDDPEPDGRRTTAVFTEFIPTCEVPQVVPPPGIAGGAELDMRTLANAPDGAAIFDMLEPLVEQYENWAAGLELEARAPDIHANAGLREAAAVNIGHCRRAAARLRAGLERLRDDRHVFWAFKFASRAMWQQRVHSIWAARNRKTGEVAGRPADHDVAPNRTWRPFQMGFILLNIVGLAEEGSEDRELVDLLWFPTGGGKTEAYLGIAAFVLALRRLRGNRHGMESGAGVAVMMRYTLRLLTVQQFQRASALIAAAEVIRLEDEDRWGTEPFQIGLWVGGSTTPNTFVDSRSALEDIREGRTPSEGSPVQLIACPRCGFALVGDRGRPLPHTYLADTSAQRTRVYCTNRKSCEFSPDSPSRDGLPVVVVDEEIYRACPSLVVATVDKFARMPFKGETQALFGFRTRFSATFGHLVEATGDKVGGRVVRDAQPATRLLPPDLIIQDELHLIAGPLGTMVGLYEAAVDYLSTTRPPGGRRSRAKIIASTATIRRASEQTRQRQLGPRAHLQLLRPRAANGRRLALHRER